MIVTNIVVKQSKATSQKMPKGDIHVAINNNIPFQNKVKQNPIYNKMESINNEIHMPELFFIPSLTEILSFSITI